MLFKGAGTINTKHDYFKHRLQFEMVKKVIVEEGITSIKEFTMSGMINATSVILPSSLKKMEMCALTMDNVKSIYIPEKVKKIPLACF